LLFVTFVVNCGKNEKVRQKLEHYHVACTKLAPLIPKDSIEKLAQLKISQKRELDIQN